MSFCRSKRSRRAVLLDHHVRDLVDPLVAGEAAAAVEALAPAANHLAFLALARVDDLVAEMAAERALHGCAGNSFSAPRLRCAQAADAEAVLRHEDQADSTTGMNEIACVTIAAATAASFGAPKNVVTPNAVGLVIAADGAGRRHRDADHEQRLQQERARKRHVDAERDRHEPGLGGDGQPERKRPEKRQRERARLASDGEAAAERPGEARQPVRHRVRQHTSRAEHQAADPFGMRRQHPHQHHQRDRRGAGDAPTRFRSGAAEAGGRLAGSAMPQT